MKNFIFSFHIKYPKSIKRNQSHAVTRQENQEKHQTIEGWEVQIMALIAPFLVTKH